FKNVDLTGANLSGLDLSQVNISTSNLNAVNLCEAKLTIAQLEILNLRGAYLYGLQIVAPIASLGREAKRLNFFQPVVSSAVATASPGSALGALASSERAQAACQLLLRESNIHYALHTP
ncbi:MAG: pentapeptide repeat-containing protein, partial [Prochloraceae cyanobacterium]